MHECQVSNHSDFIWLARKRDCADASLSYDRTSPPELTA
jgi:hypothetical protein